MLEHDIDEIYCTLPGTNNGKIVRLLNFAEKKMVRFYIVPRVLPGCKEEYGDGGDGIDPIADGPPGAFAIRL